MEKKLAYISLDIGSLCLQLTFPRNTSGHELAQWNIMGEEDLAWKCGGMQLHVTKLCRIFHVCLGSQLLKIYGFLLCCKA